MLSRRRRKGRSSLGSTLWLLVLAALIGAAYLYVPKWWDSQKIKEIARLVVTEWHLSENREVAQERLKRELKENAIPYYIPDDACVFKVSPEGNKQVVCSWNADIDVPGIDYIYAQSYAFTTEIDRRGKVQQW